MPDEGDDQKRADDQRADRLWVAPAPSAGLLKTEHGESNAACDQRCAAVIDRRRCGLVVRLGDDDQDQRDDRDRDVDPEDCAPVDLYEVSTGDRADRRERACDAKEDRQRTAALLYRVGGDDQRQSGWDHQRGADSLNHAESDDPGLRQAAFRCSAAER